MKRLLRTGLSIGALLTFGGCSTLVPVDESSTTEAGMPTAEAGMPTRARVTGAVHKGPFVIGSSIVVVPLDDRAASGSESYLTQTHDNLGNFELVMESTGYVQIEGTGFYYNEVTGKLSDANLLLRAIANTGGSGQKDLYANLITHLSVSRIRYLVQRQELEIGAAITQAEGELRTELGVGVRGFEVGKPGVEQNLLGGDDNGNAYIFAVSSVITQAAVKRASASGGSIDAALQELINLLAIDLESDGKIEGARKKELLVAQRELDPAGIESKLEERLAQLDLGGAVPDLDRVIDTDLDGVANKDDNCPVDANSDQRDQDGDEIGDACDCGNGAVNVGEQCDDGNSDDADECTNDCILTNCGDGMITGWEECDDGNAEDLDACTDACGIAVCGDGITWQDVEECDDGNAEDLDACSNQCEFTFCGDGIKQLTEECDDGNADNTDDCLETCLAAKCGDSYLWAGNEQCDDGDDDNADDCTVLCQPPACDDGITSGTEYELDCGGSCGPCFPDCGMTEVWNDKYVGTGADYSGAADVFIDGQDNVYVIGTVSDATQGRDIWLRKYDPSGVPEWTNIVDNGGDDWGVGLVCDSAGNVTARGGAEGGFRWLGDFGSDGTIVRSVTIENGPDEYRYILNMAIDSGENVFEAGTVGSFAEGWNACIWKTGSDAWPFRACRNFGEDSRGDFNDVALAPDGSIYAAGWIGSSFADGSLALLTKIDSGADLLWSTETGKWEFEGAEEARAVAVNANNEPTVVGWVGIDEDRWKIFVRHYNTDGTVLSTLEHQPFGSSTPWGTDLVVLPDGSALVVGTLPTSDRPGFILVVDAEGNAVCEQEWLPALAGAGATSVARRANGNIVIVGAGNEPDQPNDLWVQELTAPVTP